MPKSSNQRLLVDHTVFFEGVENKGKSKIMHLIHQSVGGAALNHHIANIAPFGDIAGIENGILPRRPGDDEIALSIRFFRLIKSRDQASSPTART